MDDKCVSLGPFVERTSKYYAEGPGLSSEVGEMEMLDKGVLLRTIEVTDPKARFKRNYLLFVPISSTMVFALICTILWYRGLPLELIGLVLALALSMEIVSLIVMSWALGRGLWPISIYSNGVEYHRFLFDKLRRAPGFVERTDITEVRFGGGLSGYPGTTGPNPTVSYFSIKTRKGRQYWSGPRDIKDAKAAVELIGSWGGSIFGLETQRREWN
jgi:hypothetical protein